jgi:HEAT repeat protein
MIVKFLFGVGVAALLAGSSTTPAREPFAQIPPEPSVQGSAEQPADSLYRLGREAINRGDFRRAAALFAEITAKHARSEYAPDALYWRAFSLYKAGREDDLREALKALDRQQREYPGATTIADGRELGIRIRGVLARGGDEEAAAEVSRAAKPQGPQPPQRVQVTCNDQDAEIRAAAMNALLQMDAEGAIPIIKQVLQRRDTCSISLREKAVFLLSQKRTSETEDILLDVLNNDPVSSVREQAVFWMGQVRTEKAAAALEQIATSSRDTDLRRRSIHALHEHNSPRANATIRRLAESDQTPMEVREQAIFWLGQRRSADNAEFLRGLYARVRNEDVRNKIMFSLSQMRGVGNDRWLLGLAMDSTLSSDLRGHALFTAGQAGVAGSELVGIYDRLRDRDVKEKLIWVMSESRDRVATDKLIEIAQKDPDREMRQKALFWLGQKNDPRVRQILMDILTKP